jgi:recombination protein RecA
MAPATKTKKAASTKIEPTQDAFAKIRAELQASTQKGVVEDLTREIEAIPTGMLGLDIASGIGGLPVGRIIELYGMESCGKSTLLYHLTREAQRLDYIPIMIETEGSVDRTYLRRIGVDLDRLILFSPDTMESAIDFITTASEQAKSHGQRALIMLDSVAALAPEVVMESSADQKFQSPQAAAWAAQMPKLIAMLRRTSTTLVLVNQMRESRDLYKPPSTPGGKAIKFAASLRILMRRQVDKNTDKDDLGGAHGQRVFFTIEKNKCSGPFRKGFAYLPAGRPVDEVDDVMSRAIERGVIEKDVKVVDDELAGVKGHFSINPDDDLTKAIRADIAAAEKAGRELPGTKEGPYIVADAPFSVYRESKLLEVLDAAPNLVRALKQKVYDTLTVESSSWESAQTFDELLAESVDEFDANAGDGVKTAQVIEGSMADVDAKVTSDAAGDTGDNEDDDDDLSEFESDK